MEGLHEYAALKIFASKVFEKLGADEENARLASEVLLSADLRGVESHGIARLTGYVRLCEQGRIDIKAKPVIIHETPSTAVIDGNKGLGLLVAPFSMRIAIKKAGEAGTGWVSVQNSSHFGIAGYHSMLALERDMIGIAMTNASPTVAPTFSRTRLLGTNPISVSIPAGNEKPFVSDFATTTAANGKLEVLQRKGLEAPLGWVQDTEGKHTTDAKALLNGGAMLPLGGDREHGSHKGYMLGSIVDIFSAILSGANYGPYVPPFPAYLPMPSFMPGKGIGHFFGAMRIDAFRPAQEFKKDMDDWIVQFRNAVPVDPAQPVLIPGDPERMLEEERIRNGIPVNEKVEKELQNLGNNLGVNFNI